MQPLRSAEYENKLAKGCMEFRQLVLINVSKIVYVYWTHIQMMSHFEQKSWAWNQTFVKEYL